MLMLRAEPAIHQASSSMTAPLRGISAREGARTQSLWAHRPGRMAYPSRRCVETILANGRPKQVVVDMSTVEPRTTDLIASAAAERGLTVVDAPVGRLAAHADRGESLFMVGASDEDFQRVLPMLQAMGTTIHHCGPVGAGIRTKLVDNYLAIISCQLNAEALALSQRFGLDLTKTLEVCYGTTATNGQLKINWPNKVLKGDIEPGFTTTSPTRTCRSSSPQQTPNEFRFRWRPPHGRCSPSLGPRAMGPRTSRRSSTRYASDRDRQAARARGLET